MSDLLLLIDTVRILAALVFVFLDVDRATLALDALADDAAIVPA